MSTPKTTEPKGRKKNKRGNNEGSIYTFANNSGTRVYRAVVNLGYIDGKLKRKAFTVATRQEAQAILTEAQHKISKGLPVAPERQTVAQYLTRWLDDFKEGTVRYATMQRYRVLVATHIVPALGSIILSKLTALDVQALLTAKSRAGLSARTVGYILTTLRNALQKALKLDMVERNVAQLVDPPAQRRREMKLFDETQTRAFLQAIQGDRREALYILTIACGLRQGEVLGLKWADVDLNRGVLTVRHALQRQGKTLVLVDTKTDRSRRALPVPAFALDYLKAHRDAQDRSRMMLEDSEWNAEGFVFTTQRGTPLDASNVTHEFQKALMMATLPKIRFHDLRHMTATVLHTLGVDLNTIKEVLGHSQISLTMDTYTHVQVATKQGAADTMSEYLAGLSPKVDRAQRAAAKPN